MKSNTKIKKQTKRKSNPELVETINEAKKLKSWHKVAEILSFPRRKKVIINLEEIDKQAKAGDTMIIPGKVLSQGNITKKISVAALKYSKAAEEKLKEQKCEIKSIKTEIKENPEAKGVKILN